jgi:glucosyl-3-phosphoglycerate synthase
MSTVGRRPQGVRPPPPRLVPPTTPELDSPAIKKIVITSRTFLPTIAVTSGADRRSGPFLPSLEALRGPAQTHKIIWATGPRVRELYKLLENNDLTAGADGKGRSAWVAYGYILAREESEVIGLHDCDIVNHSREMVGRLFYPVASPSINYAF